MLIGVSVIVVFIFVVVKGCITERANSNRIRAEAERERKNAEEYLKGAPARAIAESERQQNLRDAAAALEAERRRETVLQQEQVREQAREQAQNDPMAVRLYVFRLKRANDGSVEAQYDLALQYLTGQGVARDISVAKDWLQKAAAQGHKKAQKKLESLGATDAPASPK